MSEHIRRRNPISAPTAAKHSPDLTTSHSMAPKTSSSQRIHYPFTLLTNFCRHKRTHSREDGGEGSFNLSAEEEEEYSGEDQLGSLEEASPSSEAAYVPGSLNSAANEAATLSNNGNPSNSSNNNNNNNMGQTQSFNSLQTLSMPMTISHPATINASGMM